MGIRPGVFSLLSAEIDVDACRGIGAWRELTEYVVGGFTDLNRVRFSAGAHAGTSTCVIASNCIDQCFLSILYWIKSSGFRQATVTCDLSHLLGMTPCPALLDKHVL